MKIVHLCLASFFPDNFSYQENMLPKFHKKLGYEVEVIASTESFNSNGKLCYLDDIGSYINEHNIKVTRLPYKSKNKVGKKLRRYKGTYEAIEKSQPDILFIHGCQFLDIDKIIKYKINYPEILIYVDNHADFSNSAKNWVSKNFLHKIVWRSCAKKIEPFTKKFYGVLPVRVDFLKNIYKLPEKKCELLVMGADDECVEVAAKSENRMIIRERYGILPEDFLIVTGGKIDSAKKQVLLLMKAVSEISSENVKLLVFGSVTPELKEEVASLVDGNKVMYVGWVQSADSYNYFAAADLVVFPGRHSVFWEQVAAQGIPMLVKSWPGTHHVDLGGNVRFLTQDSVLEIKENIEFLLANPSEYLEMKKVAEERGMLVFSYKDIAKRAIEK